MLLKLSYYPDLPIQKDKVNHPHKRLISRNPIWSLVHSNKTTEEMWINTNVRNHSLVSAPASRVPDFDLNREQWTALNRVSTGQGRCNILSHKWGITNSPLSEYGVIQTSNIVEECQRTRFEGRVAALHNCGPTAVTWLKELDARL